ncbi:D-glycero-beta-D-manno-heptose 1-phosphate adenylyltransferase [soil metagenome]
MVKNKIYLLENLLQEVEQWKQQNFTIVFTNGCFDILHLGHVDYLEKARNLGDKLIIGLNSDNSIKRIKGAGRPIISEDSRAKVLASLMFVDAVILFNEDTPYELIKAIKPDILIKGNDYGIENIVGGDFVISNGGKVCTIDLVPGYSTTRIVNKIKEYDK